MSLRWLIAVAVASLVEAGCAECDVPTSCDVRDADCRARILDAVECVHGIEMPDVTVQVVPARELAADAVSRAEEHDAAACTRQWYRALSLLDLLRPGTGPAEAARDDISRIGGYYSSDDDAITLVDRGAPMEGPGPAFLFVHESFHAWQYARFPDLAPAEATLDAGLAFSAVLEGQATLYTAQVRAVDHGFEVDEVDWARGFDHGQGFSLSGQRGENPWLRLRSAFAYTFGTSYVLDAYERGGHVAADDLLEAPPLTTRQVWAETGAADAASGWLDPTLFQEGVPDLGELGMHHVASRRAGSFALASTLLRLGAGTLQHAQALEADELSLFVSAGGAEAAVAWRLRFTTTRTADEVASALRNEVLSLLPSPWGVRRAQSAGRDVLLIASTDSARLPANPRQQPWRASELAPDGDCVPPAEVTELDAPRVVDVALGREHACVLLSTGAVRCWGRGQEGQLGYGVAAFIGDDELPAEAGDVELGDTAVAIAVGDRHSCAALSNGDARCWGDNDALQVDPRRARDDAVGDDEPASEGAAVERAPGERFAGVAAAGDHACAVTDEGGLRCWGDFELAPVVAAAPIAQVVSERDRVCALYADHEVDCWDRRGRRSSPFRLDPVGEPHVAPMAGSVVQLAAADDHTCARFQDGAVRCRGDAAGPAAQRVPLPEPAIDLAAGGDAGCAVLEGGDLFCWGRAGSPARTATGDGIGDEGVRLEEPVQVTLRDPVVRVAVSDDHTCTVSRLGYLRCWGAGALLGLGYTPGARADALGPLQVGNVALY